MLFNRLNIWQQAPGENWANLETLPRVYHNMEQAPAVWHLQASGVGSSRNGGEERGVTILITAARETISLIALSLPYMPHGRL